MSKLNVDETAERIKSATRDSKIIVERLPNGYFKSYFADTIYGYKMIKSPSDLFLGAFYGEEDALKFKLNHIQ
jgi:hypothetical protein